MFDIISGSCFHSMCNVIRGSSVLFYLFAPGKFVRSENAMATTPETICGGAGWGHVTAFRFSHFN